MGTVADIVRNAIPLMIPLLFVALGEAVNEKSGVLNVGAEGVMILGAFVSAEIFHETGSLSLGLASAIPLGLLLGLVLAYFYVSCGIDQIAGGIIFVLLAIGVTNVLNSELAPSRRGTFHPVSVPLLVDIPGIGDVFFKQTILAYLSIAAVVLMFFVMQRTWFGMAITGAGSNPAAVDSAGLSVPRLRYISLSVGCALGALGGGVLVLTTTGTFLPGITGGIGFIALAVVVLGRWNPIWIVPAAGAFAAARSLQFRIPTFGGVFANISDSVWGMLPYLVAILIVIFARSARYPAAIGVPFRRGAAAE